ncbi:MAG: ATP-dependent DNA helicase RecG [Calditrichaceae bacterium]
MTPDNKNYELQFIKGIGPRRAEVLAKNGIKNVHDLLNFFPRKYVDRSNIVPLDKLQPEQEVTVIGRIEAAGIRKARKTIFYIVISDEKGILEAVWFNAARYFKTIFKVGDWVSLSGKVGFYRGFQLTHPEYDRLGEKEIDKLINTGHIIPFYSENEAFRRAGINSYTFRKAYDHLFNNEGITLDEYFPSELLKKRNLLFRYDAYREIHIPGNNNILNEAIRRIKYEDFYFMQLMFALQRAHLKEKPVGIVFNKKSPRLDQLYQALPFDLTAAQKKVIKEIRKDMLEGTPMNRLLQGDVGSGKTLVALMAVLIAIDNGYQAALMAPTEILADQHYINILKLLRPLNVKVSLLKGSVSRKQRSNLTEELKNSGPHLVIGTHALIQDTVAFGELGLIVIDEQHRFGVMQRSQLVEKGINADVLVMTATPIPRTLAMTAYGHLDSSVIDEMPADRKPITTVWRFDNKADKIYKFIREHLDEGEQAYIVYPLVEESEKLDLKAATEGYNFLKSRIFQNYNIALIHGRLKSDEKEQIMQSFSRGEIQLLVSTTVIEVGVDVANATIILIEHAERFGLSQLHQLRGRVGRGRSQSYCILKTPYNIGDAAQKRMRIMTESQNGFEIAEKDLELRGWGDFFGTRQHGMPEFRLANPITDRDILQQAREDAFDLVSHDPFLRAAEHTKLNSVIREQYKDKMQLISIG